MAGNSRDPGKSVTARALGLLAAFDAGHTRLTLTEMARRSDVPLATAHRLAGELEAWGALRRDEEGHYSIGLRLWEIGLLAPVHSELRETALPLMQELYEGTRENVQLAIRDGHEAVFVEKLTGTRSTPIISRAGGRLPLHSTGVGKALLAHAPAAVIQEYCDRSLQRHTPYTVTAAGRLFRELVSIRERGYAYTREEMTLGSFSVAVPVRDRRGDVIAALGLVVPSVRADPQKLAKPLLSTAEAVRRCLAEADEPRLPG